MMITNEMVEQAAIRAWCCDGESTADGWHGASQDMRADYRREARAVLEYAATLAPTQPAGKCAADRLTDYRRDLLRGYAANRQEMIREWRMSPDQVDFDTWLAAKVEDLAHATLAAEKEPTK